MNKLLLLCLSLLAWQAGALPLYGAREGRTCDNCHTLPNAWKNPEESKDRKCTLSCSVCHTDPTGGGLRNTSGKFYGQSTLSMAYATQRGYKDKSRYIGFLSKTEEHPKEDAAYDNTRADLKRLWSLYSTTKKELDAAKQTLNTAAFGSEAHTQAMRDVSTKEEELKSYKQLYASLYPELAEAKAAQQEAQNWVPLLGLGEPLGESIMAPGEGRYGGLNEDPVLSFGLDMRFATWFAGEEAVLAFPMQLDTQVALHPAHHITAYVNAGVLAKEKGYTATFEGSPPFSVKDAMLIVNELPYNLYVKAGRFVPAFGTRIDDHTSFTRRDFELDSGIQGSRVVGAEIGLAPNYPYLNASVFRPNKREQFAASALESAPDFLGVDGVGAALSAGYRELGWQLGASAMMKRRDIADGGDTNSVSAQWAFNPWFYSDKLPFTYMGEYSIGTTERLVVGGATGQLAGFHELNMTPRNGVNLKLKYDFNDPDFEIANDQQNRIGVGTDLTFIPGLRLTAMGRVIILPSSDTGADFFMFLRGWL